MISVTIINSSNTATKHWIVKDARTDEEVFSDEMAPKEEANIQLTTSSAGYGEIKYRHSERPTWSNKGFLSDGDQYELF